MSSDVQLPAATTEVVSGLVTRSDYAEAINEAYHQTVEGIFRMGGLLIEAKEDLPHGEFGPMIEDDLPFGPRTARRLMAIARDERLRVRTRVSDLPPAWGTLYELTRLDESEWAAVEPHISPEMTRSEIPKLVAKGAQLPLMSDEERSAREELEAALQRLPGEERDRLERLLARRPVPLLKWIRIVKSFAEVPRRERETFLAAAEADDPEDRERRAVQIGLQEFDVGEPDHLRGGHAEVLAPEEEDRPEFESRWVEEAMPVFALQALVRWARAFCDVTAHRDVLDGLWAARRPRKVAGDARRVADWLNRAAERIEAEVE